MNNIKRKSAVFGFSMLFSMILYMLTDVLSAYIIVPIAAIFCITFLVKKSPLSNYFLIVCISAVISVLSLMWWNTHIYKPTASAETQNCIITGTVCEYPKEGSTYSVTLKDCTVGGNKVPSKITLRYPRDYELVPGDKISFTAYRLYNSTSEDDRFFYHSLSDKCWLSASVYDNIEITHASKNTLYELILNFRKYIENKILSSYYPLSNTSVINALLTGNKTDIPLKISSDVRKSGISHILAVSGMHLSIWSGVLFLILRKRAKTKITGNIAAIIFVVFYCIFTGLSPSVLRSGIMLISVYMAAIFREKADPLNSLGLSAAVLLLFNPWLGGNISFLFSFFATFAIVGLFPVLNTYTTNKNKFKKHISNVSDSVIITLCVIFVLLPFSSFFFGYISVFSPLTSLLCTPIAELIMLFASVSLFFPAGSIIFNILFSAANTLTSLMLNISAFFGNLNFGLISTDSYFLKIWFIITSAVLITVYFLSKKSRNAMVITALLSASVILTVGICNYHSAASDIYLFIPSSSDSFSAALITDNGGTAVVTGCEGNYTSYSKIKNFLFSRGASDIDLFIIPKDMKTENNILPSFGNDFTCRDYIFPGETDELHKSNNFLYSSEAKAVITEDTDISYKTDKNGLKEIINLHNTKIVIIEKTDNDEITDENYLNGEILICYNNIPDEIKPDSFSKIIVITKEDIDLPDNAVRLIDSDINLKL